MLDPQRNKSPLTPARPPRVNVTQERLDQQGVHWLFFEQNPHPMWISERSTLRFLAVNDATVRRYGYTREQFLAMTILDISPSEQIPPLVRSIRKEQRGGVHQLGSWIHRTADDALIRMEISAQDIEFNGRDAILALAHDVTESAKHEERLRQSEERFSKAFRSSPVPITISTTSEGRYIDVNEAFLRMIDRGRDEVVGRTITDLNLWESMEDRAHMLEALEREGSVHSFETVFLSRSRERKLVLLSAEPIVLDGIPCVLGITNDVTEAKKMEEQLRHVQKMDAMGRFASGVAHQFGNMLGLVLGYCDLASNRKDLGLAQNDIARIKKTTERAAELTRQLLAFSREREVRPILVNLDAVIRELLQVLLQILPAEIDLSFQPFQTLGAVKTDPALLEQIIMNLVLNARDAIRGRGQIRIQTSNLEIEETPARLHSRVRPGSYVLLSVHDTGSGMDAPTMSKIFEPFFTTKPRGKGTGLGLSMVYAAMQQAEGYVDVVSESGKGTTFNLYFPRVTSHETQQCP